MKHKTYKIDKYYNFERHKGYLPTEHVTVEGEIKDICKKNKIVVKEIIKYDGYRVIGTRTRNRKDCKELQESIDELNRI
jgi:hypothetical protein